MKADFREGYSYAVQNLSGTEGAALADAWIDSINETVEQMTKDMLDTAGRKNLDIDYLQGFMAEIWHTHTFNASSAIHRSGNQAIQPDVNTFGSADIRIQDTAGKTISELSLKSYGTASGSYREQAATPWERYNELRNNAEKNGKTYKTYDEFLSERGLRNDENAKMSMYLGQGKLIPTEQLEQARALLSKKVLSLKGNTAPTPETAIQIARYEEVLKTLTDIVSDGKGNSSLQLTHKQAMELAKAAKQGHIDDELLKECGLDIKRLVTSKDITQEALSAGLSAAALSMVFSVAPIVINAISMLISEGEIDPERLKQGGTDAITGTAKSFLSGTLSAAITACCKTGKLGESLVDANPMAVSALVVVAIGTIESALKLATGRIDEKEMARELMQMYVTSAFSYAGGTILAAVFDGFPLAYMIGSFVGGLIGGLLYKATERIFLSFCISSGCTFFGLVEQNYRLPQSVFDDLGLEQFDFERLQFDEFHFDRFEPDKFIVDGFAYQKFGITVLRRDLIGVYSIGFAS